MAPVGHTETVSLFSTVSLSSYLWSSDLLTKCSFWRFPPLASTSKASQFFAAKRNRKFMCVLERQERRFMTLHRINLPEINAGSLTGTWRVLLKKLYMPRSTRPKNDLWAPIKLSLFLAGNCREVVWSAIKIVTVFLFPSFLYLLQYVLFVDSMLVPVCMVIVMLYLYSFYVV